MCYFVAMEITNSYHQKSIPIFSTTLSNFVTQQRVDKKTHKIFF